METRLIAAIDRALDGDDAAQQGFGVEKAVLIHPSWESRLSIDGAGVVTLFTRRSPSDRGGDEIGLFRATLGKDKLQQVLLETRDRLVKAQLKGARAEPLDLRVIFAVVAGGESYRLVTAATPPAMAPLGPLQQLLGQAEMLALTKPVRSLSCTLEVPAGLRTGAPTLIVVKLQNGGAEGHWVSNPAAVSNADEGERALLAYARPLVRTPGVTPVPVPPSRARLWPRAGTEAGPPLLWVGPKDAVSVPLQADLDLDGSSGPLGPIGWLLRAELHLDLGEDTIGGRPRMRGSVFSQDVKQDLKAQQS